MKKALFYIRLSIELTECYTLEGNNLQVSAAPPRMMGLKLAYSNF
jgi:hypothetical protein